MEHKIDHSGDLSDIFAKILFKEGDLKIRLLDEHSEDQYICVISSILKCQSNVFRVMLESAMLEKSTGMIDLSMYHPLVVKKVFQYMYTGKITIPSSFEFIFGILDFSNMYEIMKLKNEIIRICLTMVNEKTYSDIKSIAVNYGILTEEIINKCNEYLDGTAELRVQFKKEPIATHHFSRNRYYDFRESRTICSSTLFKAIIKSSHKVYLVPTKWESYCDAYLYEAVLDVDMKDRFPFLGDAWEKYFWQLDVKCPGDNPHLKIKIYHNGDYYHPSITNIYGLKSINLNYPIDMDDEIVKILIQKEDGDWLHHYFYRLVTRD